MLTALSSTLGFSTPVSPRNFADASSWDDAYASPGGTDVADWLLPWDEDCSLLKTAMQDALLCRHTRGCLVWARRKQLRVPFGDTHVSVMTQKVHAAIS